MNAVEVMKLLEAFIILDGVIPQGVDDHRPCLPTPVCVCECGKADYLQTSYMRMLDETAVRSVRWLRCMSLDAHCSAGHEPHCICEISLGL